MWGTHHARKIMAAAIAPEDLAYPDRPDRGGNARKQYRGETYYFGQYNTPESIVLFGRWKGKLVDTGEAVKPASAIVSEVSASAETAPPKPNQYWPVIIVAASMVSLAILGSAKILSTNISSTVDGVVMTEYELDLIRGNRNTDDKMLMIQEARPGRVARRNFATEDLPDDPFSFQEESGS
jgi:hypothetical protein